MVESPEQGEVQAVEPSLPRMVIETVVLLGLAVPCVVGVLLFGHATIEGWHLEHTAISGLVTHVGPCERNEDVVECPGRFASSDGRIVDRPVTLDTWRPDPTEPVPARLAGPGYPHVYGDGAPQPSTRGGLIGVAVFSVLTALFLAPVVLALRTYRRRREGADGPPA